MLMRLSFLQNPEGHSFSLVDKGCVVVGRAGWAALTWQKMLASEAQETVVSVRCSQRQHALLLQEAKVDMAEAITIQTQAWCAVGKATELNLTYLRHQTGQEHVLVVCCSLGAWFGTQLLRI